jgi:hypothetical protein
MPPCLRGSLVRQFADGQAELEFLPAAGLKEQLVNRILDEELARHLCQTRAVFPFTIDGKKTYDAECLIPLALCGADSTD